MLISVFVHLCTPVFAQEKHETTARNRTWTFYQPGRCAYHYTTEVLFAFWRHKTLFIKTKSNILTNFPEMYWFKNFTFKCKIILSIPFFSQLSDKVFYLHFTLYTLTTPKKCRQINSESQSRNYTVFVSGLIVHLFVVRNSRHWPCSRWLTCVYRACTSDGKWSSFLSAMAKWLCDLCKFHSCNTENVKCYLLWTHFFGSDF